MRSSSLIAALPLLALTACGGASGPETVGSNAPPVASGSGGSGGGVTPAPSPTPTPSQTPTPSTGGSGGGATPAPSPAPTPSTGGAGTGVSGGTSVSAAQSADHFMKVTAAKTWDAVGAMQSFTTQRGGELYTANAATVRSPSGKVTYNPRDGVFEVTFTDTLAGFTNVNVRYQDPAHRTDFGGRINPQWSTPDLNDFNYIESISGTGITAQLSTFFYQRPGVATNYVTLAGFVIAPATVPFDENDDIPDILRRGAMVFGDQTARAQIPLQGTGTYTGGMLATMTANPTFDDSIAFPTFLQWIAGTATTTLDFGAATFTLALNGTVLNGVYNGTSISNQALTVPSGAVFTANGNGTIDLVRSGGFTGQFSSAGFSISNQPLPIYDRVNPLNSTAGANSIDGTFFGPNAVNVGGNFRIVGGVPDQRVDILGAFTGAKK